MTTERGPLATPRRLGCPTCVAAVCGALAFLAPAEASAYVGPGAGIAVGTTALAIIATAFVVLLTLIVWPARWLWRRATRKKPPEEPTIKRAILIGLDGLDPRRTQRLMDEGKLPNLSRIADRGVFCDLATTYPAMSPVAWSTFATGVNPGKHSIFDFLTRDRKSYQPDLSSAEIRPPRRHVNLGPYRIPLGKPETRLLRRSKPFWEVLSRYRVPCSVLRIPITFPPAKFDGTMLSAMCVPDLQGSQGTFSFYSSSAAADAIGEGGRQFRVSVENGRVQAHLAGPPNPLRRDGRLLELAFKLTLDAKSNTARLTIGRERHTLVVGEFSEWIPVAFPLGIGMKLRGICRFRLIAIEPELRLYVTPINIDPDNPVLPISHPRVFSRMLSKLCGRFATLGLAEDTWALNERVIDERAFLEQAWANHAEREAMFFEMLKRTPTGAIACVFDGTDRIQHMFMRYDDDGHPAACDGGAEGDYAAVIDDTYARMDTMVGRVLEQVDMDDPETLITVLSDHGFQTFRRCVNINTWLRDAGYLALKEDAQRGGPWFEGVDWSRTRAFAVGLGGIFLNVRGRESEGIVAPEDVDALSTEIAEALTGLRDPEADAVAIRNAHPARALFHGPYTDESPDVIIGYAAGWRISWEGARGEVGGPVFSDNTRAWSGDHCIDPELVPGVLITNRRLDTNEASIADIAPTILELFGVPAPRFMDGRSLVPQ